MIIRHGEKPTSDNGDVGVDARGKPDDHSLTDTGWQRASGLADLFTGASLRNRPATPTAIYAAGANDQGEGTRTRETVQPLSNALGVPVNTEFGKGDEQQLVKAVESQPGPTLISWQHREIPDIVHAFGPVSPSPPSTWPDDDYDSIWTLTSNGDGTWRFSEQPQRLSPSDGNARLAHPQTR
jgi:broad specificity phosphatase PhoE